MADAIGVTPAIEGARWCPSPNFNERPAQQEIDLLVIHNISLPPGEFGGDAIEALFCNRLDCSEREDYHDLEGLRVSSHFLIDRAGVLTQFVRCEDRAWHAGVSRWGSRENCNDFSLGIELEGTDTLPYTDAQYDRLIALIRQLYARHPRLPHGAIVGHSDIAPGRKTDPGPAFDWRRLRCALRESNS